jgi:hypothetical protein
VYRRAVVLPAYHKGAAESMHNQPHGSVVAVDGGEFRDRRKDVATVALLRSTFTWLSKTYEEKN